MTAHKVSATSQLLALSDRFVSGSTGTYQYLPVVYPLQEVVSEEWPVTGKQLLER